MNTISPIAHEKNKPVQKKFVPHTLILRNNFFYSCHLAKKSANCTKICSRMNTDALLKGIMPEN